MIDWVMRTQGVSFRHAVELLRAGAAPASSSRAARPGAPQRRGRASSLPARRPTPRTPEVLVPGRRLLPRHPARLARGAGLPAPAADRRPRRRSRSFRLGLRQPHPRLPAARPSRPRTAPRCGAGCSASACCAPSGHEHLTGSRGRPGHRPPPARSPSSTAASSLATPAPGTPAHLYLPGPHRGVWNEEGLAGGEVIVCESLIDALSFWCAGFRNVTASYGTDGFTDDHRGAFAPATGHPGPHRLRPRPRRRRRRRQAGRRADGRRHRVLPGRLPLRSRRQRRRRRPPTSPRRRARSPGARRRSGWGRAGHLRSRTNRGTPDPGR